jgi:hypothetical protein
MWEEFREEEQQAPYFQDDTPEVAEESAKPAPKSKGPFQEPILGMTPVQRFLIAVMLFVTVCLLGTMFMIITEKFMLF